MMVLLEKHAEEMYWIKRRLKFLKELDQLLESDAPIEEAFQLSHQFKKVQHPGDLVDRLKEVYGDDLE